MDLSGTKAEILLTAAVIIALLVGAVTLFPPVWAGDTPATRLTMEESVAPVPIDLNTATREQLMSLDGIGETKAEAILDYRTEHGAFHSVSEAAAVKGVSETMTELWIQENLVVCKEDHS